MRGGRKITIQQPFYDLVTVHTTRRSFASNMYRMGVPSMVIAAITGHRSEKSFLTYIRLSATEKAEMMREILYMNSLQLFAGGAELLLTNITPLFKILCCIYIVYSLFMVFLCMFF